MDTNSLQHEGQRKALLTLVQLWEDPFYISDNEDLIEWTCVLPTVECDFKGRVRSLRFKENTLKHVPKDLFAAFPYLQVVSLYDSNLEEVPDFSRNLALESLDLMGTKLLEPPDLSKNLSLRYLDLSDTELRRAPNLANHAELETLNLSGLALEALPDLSNNKKLKYLVLRGTKLTNELWIKIKKQAEVQGFELKTLDKYRFNS